MQWLKHHSQTIFVMVRPIIKEQISPAEAVTRGILKSMETGLVLSVMKIGAGGFGDIYGVCLRRSITDQELEKSHWKTSVHVRKVFPPVEISLTHVCSLLQESLFVFQITKRWNIIRMR
jgi:hypothetical protein